jgi:hypothetical protein
VATRRSKPRKRVKARECPCLKAPECCRFWNNTGRVVNPSGLCCVCHTWHANAAERARYNRLICRACGKKPREVRRAR